MLKKFYSYDQIGYCVSLWNYNRLIKKNFGETVKFDLTGINKRKFEKQLYIAIYKNYDILLNSEEDYKKEIILLEANLYGS